jgi:hypothetical protein
MHKWMLDVKVVLVMEDSDLLLISVPVRLGNIIALVAIW